LLYLAEDGKELVLREKKVSTPALGPHRQEGRGRRHYQKEGGEEEGMDGDYSLSSRRKERVPSVKKEEKKSTDKTTV